MIEEGQTMRNITKQIKEAIVVDALWSISDFFYCIEKLGNNGFEISYWKDDENWAGISCKGAGIGYIWQNYPLIFIREDYVSKILLFTNELPYIVLIISKDLTIAEFTIDMDEDMLNRIGYIRNTESFSAADFWFHTVT